MSAVSATERIVHAFRTTVSISQSDLTHAVANTASFTELFKYLSIESDDDSLGWFFMDLEEAFPSIEVSNEGIRLGTGELLSWAMPYDDLLSKVSADANWLFTPIYTHLEILRDTEWALLAAGEANGKRYDVLTAIRKNRTRYQFKVNKLLMVETYSMDELLREMGKLLGVENV